MALGGAAASIGIAIQSGKQQNWGLIALLKKNLVSNSDFKND